MNHEHLLQAAETYAHKYLRKHGDSGMAFHNLELVKNKVAVATEIARSLQCEKDATSEILLAVWFMDTGYFKKNTPADLGSIEVFTKFAEQEKIATHTIDVVKGCIIAAHGLRLPETEQEKVVCDANFFIYGSEDFDLYQKHLRKENEFSQQRSVNKTDWIKEAITTLEKHAYLTEYAKRHFEARKLKHLLKMKRKIPGTFDPTSLSEMADKQVDTASDASANKKQKTVLPDRTIETMFRTTSANSQRLSSQADAKAHIMISVNTIIVSLVLGILVRKIEQSPELAIPTGLILLVNLVTIIFAILATRPNIRKTDFSVSTLQPENMNMLFFGNFFTMNFDNYSGYMLHLMEDRKKLYVQLLRNLYEQGLVLAKKYRMLKISYNVFMYGLVLSVLAFLIASNFFNAV